MQHGWPTAQEVDRLPSMCEAQGTAGQLSTHDPGMDVHTCNASMWEIMLSAKRLPGPSGYRTACLRAGSNRGYSSH